MDAIDFHAAADEVTRRGAVVVRDVLVIDGTGRRLARVLIGRGGGGHCRRGRCGRRVALGLALARLNAVLAHGERPVHAVQLVVQAASVAHGLSLGVAAPQRRRRRAAIGAAQAEASRGALLVKRHEARSNELISLI